MRDEEEWERRLLETNSAPRRIDEVRAASAARRAKREARSKTTEMVAKIVAILAATIIVLCALAVASAIIGGAYWLLTGEPIF